MIFSRVAASVLFVLSRASVLDAADAMPEPLKIEGVLFDKGTGAPVAGAPVQLDRQSTVISDALGRFVFSEVTPGAHEIWIQDPDHVPQQMQLMVEPGKQQLLRYGLDPLSQPEQEEVVIKAQRLKVEATNTAVVVEEVQKIPGTQGDVIKIVQSLPGVARGMAVATGVGGAGPLIQGAAPGDSKVLIDGHVVPLLYHFVGLTSVLNSDLLKSIDFMPSGFGAEYGEAIGGIIDVRTRPALARKFGGYVNASLIDAGFFLEGPIGDNAGFAAALRRSTVDTWLPSILPSFRGLELTVAPVYYDYQAKLEWLVRQSDRLSLLTYGSSDEARLLMLQARSGDPTFRGTFQDQIQFHRLQLGWDHSPSEAWEIRSSLMAGYDRFDIELGEARYLRAQLTQVEARSDAQLRPLGWLFLHAGGRVSVRYFHGEIRLPRMPREGEVVNRLATLETLAGTENSTNPIAAAYAIAGLAPQKDSWLSAGIRLEFFGRPMNQLAIMPRLSASHQLLSGTTLSASVGLHYQPPTQDELSDTMGQPELDMEVAWHYTLRLRQKMAFDFDLDLQAFYKTLGNLVVSDPDKTLSNAGTGKISGIQVMMRRDLSNGLFGWLAYTMMRSLRKDGPDKPWRLFAFDQTHILTLVLGYHLGPQEAKPAHGVTQGWDFGLRFQLVSGNPKTPVLGGIYDSDYDTYLRIPGSINSERMPLYHRLDLRVDYTWVWTRWALSIYLDIQNVYNHQSIEGIEYNYDFTKRAYRKGLPIIPSLGVKGSF